MNGVIWAIPASYGVIVDVQRLLDWKRNPRKIVDDWIRKNSEGQLEEAENGAVIAFWLSVACFNRFPFFFTPDGCHKTLANKSRHPCVYNYLSYKLSTGRCLQDLLLQNCRA